MNRTVIFGILLICLSLSSFAAKRNGYFINNSGDTIYVVFRVPVGLFARVPTYEKLQWKITYIDSCNRSHTLRPDQAREYWFEYKSEPIRMVSLKNSLHASLSGFKSDQNLFLRQLISGKLRLLKFYEYSGYMESNPESPDPILKEAPGSVEIYLLQKAGEQVLQTERIAYCESIRNYLSDCPEVVKAIDNSACRGDDLIRIVELYNEICSK